jgi:hypothetical protein
VQDTGEMNFLVVFATCGYKDLLLVFSRIHIICIMCKLCTMDCM